MKCPHCGISMHFKSEMHSFVENKYYDDFAVVNLEVGFCPSCHKPIVIMQTGTFQKYEIDGSVDLAHCSETRIYPIWEKNTLLDESIPEKYRKLYQESEQVNNVSPRASATLSRYLLQMLLHEELHIHDKNLQLEIEKLEGNNNVPSQLVKILQVMRRVANFGAHPKKSTNSSEIVEVEKGEAEVMLEVIQQLFDYIFVKPNQQKQFLKEIEEKYGIKE